MLHGMCVNLFRPDGFSDKLCQLLTSATSTRFGESCDLVLDGAWQL